MNENPRATDDELTQRIARALVSRASAGPDPSLVEARLKLLLTELDAEPSAGRTAVRRGGQILAVGVVTSTLAVVGAGAAAAANPYSDLARGLENLAQVVGVDWSAMPEGYTRAQYDAFWGAGSTADDVLRLSALWHSDATATKARAGQMLLDGEPLPTGDGARPVGADPVTPEPGATLDPVGPGPAMPPQTPVPLDLQDDYAALDALEAAGYSIYDKMMLADIWGLELGEAKVRAGQMVLDGEALPIQPGAGDVLADPDDLAYEAYWDAGYTQEDGEALAALWNTDVYVSKVRAGHMLVDGLPLPFAPGGAQDYVGQG